MKAGTVCFGYEGLTRRIATRGNPIKLRSHPRNPQLFRALLTFRRRDTADGYRRRRCLPLHRVSHLIYQPTYPPLPDRSLTHASSYTSINNKLYELDGLQPAPILHGPCTPSDFPTKIIPVLQRRIARYPASEIRFNLMACCRDLRIRAREIGDEDELEEQEDKRAKWLYENSLRRHNFVGFVGELLKAVTRAKLQEGKGSYEAWVEDAKSRAQRKREELRKKGIQAEE